MARREIEFVIDEGGNLTMELKGVKGTSCAAEMEALLAQLGHTPAEVTKTQEYYQNPNINIRLGGR